VNTFIEIFQGLPIVLLISFIFGSVALIRKYILTNPGIRRISIQDRRQNVLAPSFPFHDSKNILITENRRTPGNRRLASYVVEEYKILHY
jgi:hypothetical protein